ncbi:hypothetical protein [Streptococcus sp. CSL10205-OR2]|uniref:hypothetical protein n=1 Tax=Streptococcus sp. CSL10205-OR2 TaxID=2980558 RepID=UPI0021D82BD1|nr:hypothetical protein [Streptococcus sp. CSL10205-OR2]MCU9533083.1 hypothetical protein [Streptococcus sp. CSL10205-OR2]
MKYDKLDIFFILLLLIEIVSAVIILSQEITITRVIVFVCAFLGTFLNWKIFYNNDKEN